LRDLILWAIFVIAVPVSLGAPFIGLLFWTWISYFNPHQFTWGFMRTVPVAMLIAAPTLVGLVFSRSKRWPPFTVETALLLIMWLWFCITTVNVYFSPDLSGHWFEALAKLKEVSKILLITFVAMSVVTTARRLRWWYLVTAGSFAFFAVKGLIFGIVTGGKFRAYGPEQSMIGDNNDFALALNMAIPMFVYLGHLELKKYRFIVLGVFVAAIVTVVLTYSRGGMLGLAVVLFALALRSKRKVMATVGVVLIATLIIVAAPPKWVGRMGTLETAADTDPSALARIRSWKLATRIAEDHPVFGGGFETFTPELFERYSLPGEITWGPHSIYFQILGEHGFPGLLLFFALLATCLLTTFRVARGVRGVAGCEWISAYCKMLQVSFIAFLVSGAFLGRAYFDLLYQLVATVIIVKVLASQELQRLSREGQETVPSSSDRPSDTVFQRVHPILAGI
jgi:probable O-glycosylation ligase (exosortase A-associated)